MEFAAYFIQKFSPSPTGLLIRRKTEVRYISRANAILRNKFAIVMQGPLENTESINRLLAYTDEILASGLVHEIIVSTWENEFTKLITPKNGLKLVLNKDTGFANNLQRQMQTTYSGLIEISESVDFAMKMRVDQRLSLAGIAFMFDFSSLPEWRDKILFTSFNSYIYRIFGLSDMLNVGSINNMKLFWGLQVLRDVFKSETATIDLNEKSWVAASQVFFNESFLCMRYAYARGMKFSSNSWNDYLKFLREYTAVVDAEVIGQVWLKIKSPFYGLTSRSLHNRFIEDYDIEITQSLWFAIYLGLYDPQSG